jgi:3-oxoacyl-[acyl-carrier-protein] synthase III
MMTGARLAGLAVHLPEHRLSTVEVENRLAAMGFSPPRGLIGRLTGISNRHVMPDDWQASDLAVAAARKLIANAGVSVEDVDLLIFASASQDMVEPATGHIVAAKLGLRCPVMDVKNACNSVLNGLELADALITAGRYRRVLVVSGESPSRAVRWKVSGLRQFLTSLPGYTLSDAGAALLLEASIATSRILGCGFTARSVEAGVSRPRAGGARRHPCQVGADLGGLCLCWVAPGFLAVLGDPAGEVGDSGVRTGADGGRARQCGLLQPAVAAGAGAAEWTMRSR